MEHRQLGSSGLRVSALAFGCNTFGGTGIFSQLGSTDAAAASRLVDTCLEAGVNLFDTADEYSGGLSEEILGSAVAKRRDRVLIATKTGTVTGPGPNEGGLSRTHIISSCEGSLRRLKTDYIDLYQLHRWDGQTAIDETLEALDTLVRAGKVRYIGACNFSAWHLVTAALTARQHGLIPLTSHHIHYSPLSRDAEHELLPAALHHGIGVLVWSPLAGGLLSGKYTRDQTPPPPARHLEDWNEPPVADRDRLYRLVDLLVAIGDGHGVPAARVALAWLLRRPGVTSLVLGARTQAQLEGNLLATELTLSDGEAAELDTATRLPLPYPGWHQLKIAGDRLGAADIAYLGPYLTSPQDDRRRATEHT